jgi:hypothetical protein
LNYLNPLIKKEKKPLLLWNYYSRGILSY